MAWAARFDSARQTTLVVVSIARHPEVAIAQCSRPGGITVATSTLAQDADNVVSVIEDFGGPPLPHWKKLMWASTQKNQTLQACSCH